MLQLPAPKFVPCLSLLLLLTMVISGHAQDRKASSRFDAFFGLNGPSFERIFGEAIRRKAPPTPSTSLADTLADNVTELRLYLTAESDVVRGEIATGGPSALAALSVVLEGGTVSFRDGGVWPDQVKGDKVYTAVFKLNTKSEFEALRPDLEGSLNVLNNFAENILVRRGPRDIVTAAEVIREAGRKTPELLHAARREAERLSRLLDYQDPLQAARDLGIDIAKTPLLRIPGQRLDENSGRHLKFDSLFDLPIVTIFPPPAPPVNIDYERSLLITSTGVVEDNSRSFDACTGTGSAGGAWSFGHLMRELSFGTELTPEEFTLHWLSSWQIPQEANGWLVHETARGSRLRSLVIDSWRRLSPGGVFNVDYFPARLLAIVNRPDLADHIGYGTVGSAGEGRLVFGLVFKDPHTDVCEPLSFTVNFEYGIAAGSCMAVKAWQQRWKDLDQFSAGSPPYNQALELITRDFSDHGSNPSQLPNMSSLTQLRTNETVLNVPWQLREFRLQENGLLDLVTVKQTPDNQFESQGTLGVYLGINEADILADRHVVPERFPGVLDPFLGAVANTLTSSFFWSADIGGLTDPAEARRKFSLATCNGCHSGETETQFTHIGTEGKREMGTAATLSGFLVGESVSVPVTGGKHHYEDLTERKIAMSNLLMRSCFRLLGVHRLPFVH